MLYFDVDWNTYSYDSVMPAGHDVPRVICHSTSTHRRFMVERFTEDTLRSVGIGSHTYAKDGDGGIRTAMGSASLNTCADNDACTREVVRKNEFRGVREGNKVRRKTSDLEATVKA